MRPLAVLVLLAAALRPAGAASVREWKLDEGEGSVAASTQGGLRATLTGVAWSEGRSGMALEFRGPDDSGPYRPPGSFARVEASEGLNPGGPFEVAASVYPTALPVAWGGIVEKGGGYGASFRLLLLRDGRVRGAVGHEHLTVDSPDPLPLERWSRLRLVYDGRRLRLSIEGREVAATEARPTSLASDAPIEFGRRFTGRIDEVRIAYGKP